MFNISATVKHNYFILVAIIFSKIAVMKAVIIGRTSWFDHH